MEINSIYEGDNLEILSKFPDKSVDLIYADPPFFSNRHYEIIWDDGAEIRAFQDRWKGGIEHYISWMEPRLEECQRVLKDTGSMYLHCDWHANAHLRILMDRIFKGNFKNEIIWKRTSHPKGSQFKEKKYGVYTDSILFYTKSDKYTFELRRAKPPLSQEGLEAKYSKTDSKGLYYVGPIIRSPTMGARPNLVYDYKGFTPKVYGWRMEKEKLIQLDKKGNLGWTANKTPFRKLRPEDDEGEPLGNLWDDIDRVSQGEQLGYPTQKPVALLKRIVDVSSNKNDIVLDPFCGCGTTIVASHKLDRKWIGIDVSPTACKLMRVRMRKLYNVNARVIKGEIDLAVLKKYSPFEFQNWVVVDKFLGTVSKTKSGDMGIDGTTPQITGGYPIQVKQSDNVGRNVIDNFQPAMDRVKKKKGYIVAYSFVKGAYEEAARVKNEGKYDIILRTVEELLEGKVE